MDTFTHALAAATDKDAAVKGIDDEPHDIGLHTDFILDVTSSTSPTALDDLLDLPLVSTELARVDLVEHAVAHTLDEPDFVGAVCVLETVQDEATEGSHTNTRSDQHHWSITAELTGKRVGHETAEHGDAEVKDMGRVTDS